MRWNRLIGGAVLLGLSVALTPMGAYISDWWVTTVLWGAAMGLFVGGILD